MTANKKMRTKQTKKIYEKPRLTQVRLAMKTSILANCWAAGTGNPNGTVGCPTQTCAFS